MLLPTLLSLAASASAAIDYMALPPAALIPRETDATNTMTPSSECLSAAQEVLTTFPTPPAKIQSELIKLPQSDPCSFSTPASLSSEFAQFSADVVEWMSVNEAKLNACPALASFKMVATCDKAKDDSNVAKATDNVAKATDNVAKATDAAKTTKSANAGPRETGIALAAVAAAGFAVMVL